MDAHGTSSAERPTLRWRIVTVLLTVSLLPLALMGAGAWVVFGRLLDDKAVELQRRVVRAHADSISSYLATQRQLLELVTESQLPEDLARPDSLGGVLEALNRSSASAFVDLGVIGEDGRHVAYAGPFDLAGRNYAEAEWFHEVMVKGVFVSDVFLGFRQVPHFIIAIRKGAGDEPWILRATINSDTFDRLVRTGILGRTGEAFLVNREGLYQTAPRVGSVLDPARSVPLEPHSGVRDLRLDVNGTEKILVTTWLNANRWMLVVQQDAAEIRAPVTRAFLIGALLASFAVLVVALTTVLATRHLSNQIDRANREREEMFRAFMRSAKLASVGELATGLAHEINNPLAIISAEQTNISDLVPDSGLDQTIHDEIVSSAHRIRDQVRRCANITTKMLQFGRKQDSSQQPTALAPRLRDIAALLERQASVRNVKIQLDVARDLPDVLIDPLELEQVLVNLITNSFQAMPEGGRVILCARWLGEEVRLEVHDTGVGMPAQVRERVFEPFFTTKPVGQGTGLGLSVCYGIVQSWGGRIEIDSEAGEGTTIRIRLPLPGAGDAPEGGRDDQS